MCDWADIPACLHVHENDPVARQKLGIHEMGHPARLGGESGLIRTVIVYQLVQEERQRYGHRLGGRK